MNTQDNNQQGQSSQQTIYVVTQPYVAPKPTASPEVKEAAFSAGSSVFMLILCIVGTFNLISGLIGRIMTFSIWNGLVIFILELLMVIGMWITFANSKRKELSSKGISLIRVPYVIQFVFSVFTFVGNLVLWLVTLSIINLIVGILTFIFQCVCFNSVNKTLLLARDINLDKPVTGRKAGSFAAIIMIISAAFTFASEIVSAMTVDALIKAFENVGLPRELLIVLGSIGDIAIIIAAIAFVVSISGAIVMLKFGKKVKAANEQ